MKINGVLSASDFVKEIEEMCFKLKRQTKT